MLMAERQSRLEELVARRGMCDLETLSSELGVSQSTIRRDLDGLEARGLVKRTHGGVVWLGDRTGTSPTTPRPYAFDQRLTYQTDAKAAIAQAARKFVQPNQTIVVDGGTTTFHFAQTLAGLPLALVTNSLPIANLFLNDENIETMITGGLLYPKYGVLLGPHAEHTLDSLHPQTLFFSVAGISSGVLFNQNLLLVQAEQKMMQRAQRKILLADSAKFGQQALVKLCDLKEVDVVISDAGLPSDQREQVRSAGCELVIAE
jgi:DeoR/GlpR family transcriptional regulator of sugar metabolism